ncbi:DUF2946 family protein [Ralstonia soli]|uniref:DUF2946 domain-containing protein n=1 Tax=Ralstonia soli TaxID=2953896 RepID=A0ABT1ALC7_9RALS|nr:DUF2946 family protein [Ralstonia soli]MCO5399239.1 hypothetical protein [Ralstonia soli]
MSGVISTVMLSWWDCVFMGALKPKDGGKRDAEMGTEQGAIVPWPTHLVLHCAKFGGIALHYRFLPQTIFGPACLSMHRLLTRLLLWLVVLALPLQGFAATAMMAHAGATDDAAVAMTMPADNSAVMSDACHEHEEAMAGMMADGDTKAPTQSHCKTCPICAACSLGSVVPLAASLGVPLITLPAAAPRAGSVSFRSFIPEALQRPPSIRV